MTTQGNPIPNPYPVNGEGSQKFKNRIVGYRVVSASELQAHPENWREHPQAQISALEGVLESVGWVGAAIYNVRTGRLLDGHARKDLASDDLIPVLDVDVSEEEESLILATLDPISAMAQANKDKLAGLLEKARGLQNDPRIKEMMEKLRKQHGVNIEPEAAPEIPIKKSLAELQEKWQVKPGQVWQAGDLSLWCGRWQDNPISITPQFIPTDPPYNTTFLEFDEQQLDLQEFWEKCPQTPETVFLITASGRFMWDLHASNSKAFRYEWIWEKHHTTNPLAANDMPLRCHEYGLVFCKGKLPAYYPVFEAGEAYSNFRTGKIDHHGKQRESNFNDRDFRYAKSIVKIALDPNIAVSNGEQVLANHPTQKPLELWSLWMKSYTMPAEWVFDPFGGSGVTLVAAAQLGRRAVVCEMNPEYCALALERVSQLGIEMRAVKNG